VPLFGVRKKKNTNTNSNVEMPRSTAASPHGTAAPRRAAKFPAPHTLPYDGDEALAPLVAVAAARDWNALRAGLAAHSDTDMSMLNRSVCANSPDLIEWLPQVEADLENDALAQAVLGADAIERAWRVRTGKRAQHVSRDQFREFHRILRIAEEHLYASAELDPRSVAPWHPLLASGLGLQVELDVQRRRFEAVTRRSPGHPGAHRSMLQKLCRKWSGSHEMMHAFATEAMRGPHGAMLGDLVPQAYFEHYGDLDKDSPERRFIQSADSRAELLEAAERTIFSADYRRDPRSPYAASNRFAWAFCTAGMWPEARKAFQVTEGVVVNWAPFSDPVAVYTRQRTIAFQKS
jgi:hypothetical protein